VPAVRDVPRGVMVACTVAEESEEIHERDTDAENGCGDIDHNEPTHDEWIIVRENRFCGQRLARRALS
jgi:hypothetical protein